MDGSDAVFYQINEGKLERVEESGLDPAAVRICYLAYEKLADYSRVLGFSASQIRDFTADSSHFRNSIDVFDECSVGVVNIVDIHDVMAERDRMAFIIMKNLFVMVRIEDADGSEFERFERVIRRFQNNATLGKVIYGVLEGLLEGSNKMLEDLDRKIMEIESRLLGDNADRGINRTLYAYRRRISIARNYYEQLIDIGEELEENENEIFAGDSLRLFRVFVLKAERISNSLQLMSENVIHLRESLEAVVNYNLNRIMKVFTVITSIFLPLTLIVGWYGMNFKYMPELNSPYGYLGVIVLSILVVIANLIYFRKKKLM